MVDEVSDGGGWAGMSGNVERCFKASTARERLLRHGFAHQILDDIQVTPSASPG
jgi:hypothetical protein